MNKIFRICTYCFNQKEDPPEEVKPKKKEEDDNRSEIKFIVNNPNEPAQLQAGLELPKSNEYIRKKYVRKQNKSLLNISISENDESISSLTSNKIKQ